MMIWRSFFWGTDFKIRISKEQFKVHSVFRSVCNLQSSVDQPLLCLVTKMEMSAPNTLLVRSDNLYTCFEKGMSVHFTQDILHLGSIMVDCSDMQSSHQSAPKYFFKEQDVQRLVRLWLDNQWPGWNQSVSRITMELARGLLGEDEQRLLWALNGYIGFGEGLTPSGDDFVAGIFLGYVRGLNLEQKNNAFIKGLPLFIKRFNRRTNAISQTMLWYAVHGEGASYLTEVVDALYSNSYQALNLSSQLFKVGASSGRYLLAGISLGCELFRAKGQWKNEGKSTNQTEHIC